MIFEAIVLVCISAPLFLLGVLLGYRATNRGFVQRIRAAKIHAARLTAVQDERVSARTAKAVKFALDAFEEGLK